MKTPGFLAPGQIYFLHQSSWPYFTPGHLGHFAIYPSARTNRQSLFYIIALAYYEKNVFCIAKTFLTNYKYKWLKIENNKKF